jgi:hypothetical protein
LFCHAKSPVDVGWVWPTLPFCPHDQQSTPGLLKETITGTSLTSLHWWFPPPSGRLIPLLSCSLTLLHSFLAYVLHHAIDPVEGGDRQLKQCPQEDCDDELESSLNRQQKGHEEDEWGYDLVERDEAHPYYIDHGALGLAPWTSPFSPL